MQCAKQRHPCKCEIRQRTCTDFFSSQKQAYLPLGKRTSERVCAPSSQYWNSDGLQRCAALVDHPGDLRAIRKH